MERRALLAVAMSIAILLLYQEFVLKRFYPPPEPGSEQPPVREEIIPGPPAGALPGDPLAERRIAPAPAREAAAEVAVETDLYTTVITAAGGRLRSLKLKHYRTSIDPGSPMLEMVSADETGVLPMGLELRAAEAIADDGVVYEIDGGPMRLSGAESGELTLTWRAPGITVQKRLRFKADEYPIGLDIVSLEIPPEVKEVGLDWTKALNGRQAAGGGQMPSGVVALLNNKRIHRGFADIEKGEVLPGTLGWVGYEDSYFLSAVIPEAGENSRLWLKTRDRSAEVRVLERPPGAGAISYRLYLGPKDFDVLGTVGRGLDRAIDFGYFEFIAVPLLRVLKLSNTVTGNYGIDIILLTLAIKILFIPLTQKSFKSMKEMQKLQPQMAKLREKLKDKPEEMNREIMELYRRHKVNPLSGCLPMLLQVPVFIGLYNALINAIELRHAPFALWISDLSQPDRLGALHLPFVEPPGIPVLTLTMGGTMLLQQWMTPAAGDPMQQRMMMIMPLMFTFMFVNFPSGLVLYWLVNNVLTIAQQYLMMRKAA